VFKTAKAERQANCPEELLAPSRDQEENRGGATGQSPKAGEEVDPGANLWDRRQHSKLNLPHLAGVKQQDLTKQICS
jgi:hypothetical protein